MKFKKFIIIFIVLNLLFSTCVYAIELPKQYINDKIEYRIESQGLSPWCVAYVVCNSVEAQMKMQGIEVPPDGFSKVWLYLKCKEIDGVPNERGTYIYTALEIAKTIGLCPEYACPTINDPFVKTKPKLTEEMDKEAGKYKIESYKTINIDIDDVKQKLVNNKIVIVGTQSQNEIWKDGDDLILPGNFASDIGHVTFLYGYDDLLMRENYTGFFFGVNSWSENWGDNGTYDMSYEYFNSENILELWEFEISKPDDKKEMINYRVLIESIIKNILIFNILL